MAATRPRIGRCTAGQGRCIAALSPVAALGNCTQCPASPFLPSPRSPLVSPRPLLLLQVLPHTIDSLTGLQGGLLDLFDNLLPKPPKVCTSYLLPPTSRLLHLTSYFLLLASCFQDLVPFETELDELRFYTKLARKAMVFSREGECDQACAKFGRCHSCHSCHVTLCGTAATAALRRL